MPGTEAPSPLLTHFRQQQELAAQEAAAAATTEDSAPQEATSTDNTPSEPCTLTTEPDVLGIFRTYPCVPSREPSNPNPYAGCYPTGSAPRAPIASNLSIEEPSEPSTEGPGFSRAAWSAWLNSGSPYKSCGESNRITPLFTNPAWNSQDFVGYNAFTESRRFDREHFSQKAAVKCGDEWKEAKIDIPVPCVGFKKAEKDTPVFTVEGLLYRDLVGVITEQLKDPDSFKEMFLQPFSEHWKPTESDPPVRVYGEIYSSDAMLEAQRQLPQKLRDLPRPQPEPFLVALMLASDSTFLTQFSQASMWPIYMFFGNVSKYIRCSPDSLSAHHVAYLPKVCQSLVPLSQCSESAQIDDKFSEFYMKTYHRLPTAEVVTFVKRELIHRVLRLMFGGRFSEAHEHGIITECADRMIRRWFPWLACHSTDYPERFVLFSHLCRCDADSDVFYLQSAHGLHPLPCAPPVYTL